MSVEFVKITRKMAELFEAGQPFVSVTLVGIRGSAPQIIGAKALVGVGGLLAGTVGGGKIEARAIAYAQEKLGEKRLSNETDDNAPGAELVTWNLQKDIGMTCGGEVQLFFETHLAQDWPIAIFGAGHVSQVLVRQLLHIDCRMTVIDWRPEWLEKLPHDNRLQRRLLAEPKDAVKDFPPSTYFVLMTQGHATDLPILREILTTRNAPFVGVIGSRQKAKVLRKELHESGVSIEKAESFHCPVGLPLGKSTPGEISISIIAQLLQVRDANPGLAGPADDSIL